MNVLTYGWPIALLVVAHTVYQISAKSVPSGMDPFAAVFFNYVVAACLAFCLWMILGQEISQDILNSPGELGIFTQQTKIYSSPSLQSRELAQAGRLLWAGKQLGP